MKTIPWKASALLPLALAAGFGGGCVGNIGDSASGGESSGGPTPEECKLMGPSPGDTLARRMTRFEYNNTVRDLLGDTTRPADQFPADEVSGVFDNQSSALVVTQLLASGYMNAAETLATNATKDIDKLVGCDVTQKSPSVCGNQFIADFGPRAFRHPLTSAEKSLLTNVFDTALSKWDYPTAIRLVIQTALQSPHFLYRIEFGKPDPEHAGMNKLDGYEIASRLSYLFWGSMPDDALFQAAANDELATAEQIATQANRLLHDPRARAVIDDFHTQWLGLGILDTTTKDAMYYPTFTPAVKATWEKETLSFVEHVIFDGEGDMNTLLTAPYTMANKDVAGYYGLKNGPTGSAFVKTDLDPKQRSGFLTQPALMGAYGHAGETAPVQRGRFVRERLLCEIVAPPPANVNAVPPAVDPNVTLRQRFKQHETDAFCASCHHLMDPIGFGFENYDSVGAWRSKEAGKPVNAHGDIVDSEDADGAFDGAIQLGQRLAGSDEVHNCMVQQWFTYAEGRAQTESDACSVSTLRSTFETGKYDIKTLLVALTQTDTFRYRKPVVAGK
jgi:hypothetical protein